MLTHKQAYFLGMAIDSHNNIYLSGKAGTGKSFIVRKAIEELKAMGKKVACCAPTGIAANNIEGQTIHSLFSIPPFGVLTFEECNYMKDSKKALLKAIDVLIIDEISMLRPDILDGMHWTLKKNGLPGLETKVVIFVGDLKQLKPVIDDNTRSKMYETYDGYRFTDAKIYAKLKPIHIELDEVLRQSNPDFIEALNIVRDGGKSPYFKQFTEGDIKGVILAPHNATVKMYNEAGLKAQPGEEMIFTAQIEGTVKPEEFSLEQEIRVKNGCKIMYLVNSKDNPLRNGTIGIFVSHNGCHFIRVNNTDFALELVTASKKQYVYDKVRDALILEEIGSITQYPFKLAYALSIHKSQGMTFEQVTVDLRRPCFEPEQLYVALSRVTGPEGLKIII